MANEVRLTFAGDSQQLEKTFDRVGGAAKSMGDKVDDASRTMTDSGASFDKAAEGFDRAEQRAMGFRDTITGAQDAVKGFGSILKGDFSGDALLAAGAGVGDLASGFANFLLPSLKNAVTWIGKTKVGMAIATAAQWLWNAAISANPIGLIIIAVAALIAVIVLLITHWDQVKEVAGKAWDWIKEKAVGFWDWLKTLPDKIGSTFSGIASAISQPFRTAFNFIADAWNNTVGKLAIPKFSLFGQTFGGFSMPRLPHFHSGGVVPGLPGQEVLAVLQAGERVQTAGQAAGRQTIVVNTNGNQLMRYLVQELQSAIRDRGGNVQLVLGS